MRAAVVVFPGSNAETEMVRALGPIAGNETVLAWHADEQLPPDTDLVAIPGGFSYGDYLRCGAIAKAGRIVQDIRRHADRGGLVLGVCNGFQVLTETGLLPGALVQNAHLRFECSDIHVRVDSVGPFTRTSGAVLRLPIAHAEGRYHVDANTLSALVRDDRIAFRYCDAQGGIGEDSNPNGSVDSIAGIYGGPAKNVLGLMPHPERAAEEYVGGTDGRQLFDSVTGWFAARAGTA